jgi:hypothetical protein
MTKLARLALLAIVPFAAGCSASLSASSESSSKIVSSPFESSSSSLKSSETRYREGVRDHTVSYVRSGGTAEGLQTQIADLARQRGIADWQASNATWEGIGEGLARAGVKGADFETHLTRLTGSDPARMATVRAAYERALR